MRFILFVIRWILGVFFALSFLTYITQSSVASIGSLLLAIMLIPPAAKFVFTKIPYALPKRVLAIFGAVLFFVTMSAVPQTDVKGASIVVTPTPTFKVVVTKIPTPTPTRKPTPTPTAKPTPTAVPTVYVAPTYYQTQQITPTSNTSNGLTNDNYYTNSSGNQVHSPAYSTTNTAPAGATALCNDGTYSFSQHRSGTCSHHGGVAQWL